MSEFPTFNNEILSESISYHYIQLPKFIEEVRKVETPEEQWLAYLSCQLNSEELEELFKMNKSIEEINKIVDVVLEDKDVQDAIFYRVMDRDLEMLKQKKAYEDGEKAGEKRGEKRGEIRGEDKKTREIAKKLLQQKIDIEIIMTTTGLSREEIEKLK